MMFPSMVWSTDTTPDAESYNKFCLTSVSSRSSVSVQMVRACGAIVWIFSSRVSRRQSHSGAQQSEPRPLALALRGSHMGKTEDSTPVAHVRLEHNLAMEQHLTFRCQDHPQCLGEVDRKSVVYGK